ncbi:5'-AMP-activated protein kinase subunit beta-1 [Nymphon striatum]|nr:5'-AMP-activated protein kinase subunit beta-1 [Nymphon striatum]
MERTQDRMGNTGGKRERNESGDSIPSSPGKEGLFDFTGKKKLLYQSSLDDSDDYQGTFGRDVKYEYEDVVCGRTRTSTIAPTSPLTEHSLPTIFRWDGGGKQVFVSGTFTDWKCIPMVKSQGDFVAMINLSEGEHQYKFLVDDQWTYDPNHNTIENESGTKNNVMNVNKSDFEVFDALAMDSIVAGSSASETASTSGSPPGEYSQIIPQRKPYEKSSGPPILPPHLLQVILNRDVPLTCEPTLLPEPNHVMLNHLYALSIKDGVMVLSVTNRFKKKYVTTLLYKPI